MANTRQSRDNELEAILEKVRQTRNFDFRNYKRATLQRRIERRIVATGCASRTAYLALLEGLAPLGLGPDAEVSVKLSAFGQALPRLRRRLRRDRRGDRRHRRVSPEFCAVLLRHLPARHL